MTKGFEVKVEGEYIARSGVMGKERVIKNYEIKCIVPDLEKPLSVIKNKILAAKLRNKYEDYSMFRTYHITEINPLSDEDKFSADLSNVKYMSKEALLGVIRKNALKVPYDLYPDLFKLREAVQFAMNDPKGYERQLDLRREDLELDKEVAGLNPDIAPKGSNINEDESNDAPTPATPKVKRVKKNLSKEHITKQTEDRVYGLAADMKKDGEMGEMDGEESKKVADLGDL